MDITENEEVLKLISYAAAAVWVITAGVMSSPLSIPNLGWIILACHLIAAFTAYCLKDMHGDNPAGWVFTMLFCPAAAPALMRKDVDGYTGIAAVAAVILFTFGWIVIRFFPPGLSLNLPLIISIMVSYFYCVIFAVRIAEDNYKNVWLWGIGSALFPPLLLVLLFRETDFEEAPGGRFIILFGVFVMLILTPFTWIASKLGVLLSPIWEKISNLFSGSGSDYSGGYNSTVSKSCGTCGGAVSASAMAGGRCPHCGVYWSTERTTRR